MDLSADLSEVLKIAAEMALSHVRVGKPFSLIASLKDTSGAFHMSILTVRNDAEMFAAARQRIEQSPDIVAFAMVGVGTISLQQGVCDILLAYLQDRNTATVRVAMAGHDDVSPNAWVEREGLKESWLATPPVQPPPIPGARPSSPG